MGDNYFEFLLISLFKKDCKNWGLLIKERIFPYRSKFFLIRADTMEEGGKHNTNKMTELLPLKSVVIHLIHVFLLIYKDVDACILNENKIFVV